MMKGLAILALLAATVAGVDIDDNDDGANPGGRLSACDTDRGEPVCLDKMAAYSACLGPELAERFKTAAAQCYFGANEGEDEDEEVSEEVIEDRQRPGKGKGKK